MLLSPRFFRPFLFDVFQFFIGGTIAKRELVLGCYEHQPRVLEIGCSTGNIARAFIRHKVSYTGVDIDEPAIAYARAKFRKQANFRFLCGDMRVCDLPQPFDFILFSGVLHHLDDRAAREMLELCATLLAPGGCVCVSDPLKPREADGWLIKAYRKLERGENVMSWDQLSQLLSSVKKLQVVQSKMCPVTALPFGSRPVVSHFGVLLLRA